MSKTKGGHKTFGNWKDARLAKGTALSTMTDELRLITALRDETVYNGTIDHFSRVYEHVVGAHVKKRFILLPDHDKGKIHTAGGRKRFFHQDDYLNEVLPTILDRVFADLLSSLLEIDSKIEPRWDNLESYHERHSMIVDTMDRPARIGGFMKFDPSDHKI